MKKIKKILLLRDLENSLKTQQKLQPYPIIIDPLFHIEYLKLNRELLDQYKYIVTTSNNALKALKEFYNPKQQMIGIDKEITNLLQLKQKLYDEFEGKFDEMIYLCGNIITEELPIKSEVIYKTIYKDKLNNKTVEAIKNNEISAILFYSNMSVSKFLELIKIAKLIDYLSVIDIFVLSEKITCEIPNRVFNSINIAEQKNNNSMVKTLNKFYEEK